MDYTPAEKQKILTSYLDFYGVTVEKNLLPAMSQKIAPVPREIHNFAVKLRDYLVSHQISVLSFTDREDFLSHTQIQD